MDLLILAVLDISTRSAGRILGRDSATQSLIAIVSILLASLVVIGIAWEYEATFLRLGPLSWCILIAYLLSARLIYFDDLTCSATFDEERASSHGLSLTIVTYLACVAALFVAAPRLATVADQLGEVTGIGHTFIGASFGRADHVASRSGHDDRGHSVGALRNGCREHLWQQRFNILILATVDLATPQSLLFMADAAHLVTAGAVILTTSAAVLGLPLPRRTPILVDRTGCSPRDRADRLGHDLDLPCFPATDTRGTDPQMHTVAARESLQRCLHRRAHHLQRMRHPPSQIDADPRIL